MREQPLEALQDLVPGPALACGATLSPPSSALLCASSLPGSGRPEEGTPRGSHVLLLCASARGSAGCRATRGGTRACGGDQSSRNPAACELQGSS